MKSVKQLLATKPNLLWFIPPDATTFDGNKMLAEKSVGALPVMKGDLLVGIFFRTRLRTQSRAQRQVLPRHTRQ